MIQGMTLYAVAWFKHGEPQHLAAGPFVRFEDAEAQCKKHNLQENRHEVVSCDLTGAEWKEASW